MAFEQAFPFQPAEVLLLDGSRRIESGGVGFPAGLARAMFDG